MTAIDIAWAGSASLGAERMVGPPDAHTVTIGLHVSSATVREFTARRHEGVGELLAAVVAGDRVNAEQLASADVIAFDHNGNAPAPSGGFESCDWTFTDGTHTFSVRWDDGVDASGVPLPRDPHVVANGTVSGTAFADVFDVPLADLMAENPAAATPELARVSFLLFRLRPEIDVTSPQLSVTISQTGIPDVDSVGVLRHQRTIRLTTRELTYPLFSVPGVTPRPVDGSVTQSLTMPPGTYAYWSGEGSPAFEFSVGPEGLLDYHPSLDGFLSGRGSGELTVRGVAVTLNAVGLVQGLEPLDVFGPTAPLAAGQVHRLTLVPSTRYTFRCGPAPGTLLRLALTPDGSLVPT